jgi:hypothetical protein
LLERPGLEIVKVMAEGRAIQSGNAIDASWRINYSSMAKAGCAARLNDDALFDVVVRIAQWLAGKGVAPAPKTLVYVVTTAPLFSPKLGGTSLPLTLPSSDPAVIDPAVRLADEPRPDAAREARVISQGEPYPGEDVAVLRLIEGVNSVDADRLICLPLGDSDDPPRGTRVIEFGFPGVALMPGLVRDDEHPQVIAQVGLLTQRVATSRGWTALYTTAPVNHGQSGGPVVAPWGRAIGLVDYGSTNDNLAVPINVAKKYLRMAGVDAKPGPLTQHWLSGQDYVEKGDYEDALREFEIVNGDRPENEPRGFPGTMYRPGHVTSHHPGNQYVVEAIQKCLKKLGH